MHAYAQRSLLLLPLLLGCGSGPIVIDGRGDSGMRDAGPARDSGPFGDAGPGMDAGATDAGSTDGGPPDGGCMNPPLPTWTPSDTGGPDGEGVLACVNRVGGMTDDRLPADQRYDLTTFGGPGDEQPVACSGAPDADGTWYYAANRQRFRCGQRVRLVNAARSACVILEVADIGPNICVEEAGERPIWDVSPLVGQALYSQSAIGWSEHLEAFGAPVDSGNALGPCDTHLTGMAAGFVGSACSSAGDCGLISGGQCLSEAEGYPGGHCTQPCETSCPDQEGAFAYTACADPGDGVNRCFARCDFTLSTTGCRDGYVCTERPAPGGSGDPRSVCLPDACD